MLYFFLFTALLLLEIGYFKLADRFNIIDKPNERSSHSRVTLRGGGVIFYFGVLFFFAYSGFQYPWFFTGLTLIAAVSFIDDVMEVRNLHRVGIHLLSVGLMFLELNLYPEPWWLILLAAIITIGTINAYNFMDGINGITGGYSLAVLGALGYVNSYVVPFASGELIAFSIISLIVFNIFNYREKARCFAGDVGSVSIAFIVIFLLASLIMATQNLTYILLLSVYGVDSVLTILHRLYKKENIFQPHRSHLYQVLANEGKWPHVWVSLVYMSLQAIVCWQIVWISGYSNAYQATYSASLLAILSIGYVLIKRRYSADSVESKVLETNRIEIAPVREEEPEEVY